MAQELSRKRLSRFIQDLDGMLEMGASRPWPEALEAVSGRRDMDATAILDYFEPLTRWLDEQNSGRSCGW